MSDPRWQRIEEICHAALERSPDERGLFVRETCAGDDALRAEVQSLLANQSRADALGSGLGIRDSGVGRSTDELIGTQIGVYRIGSRLGAGGMGEVYRARDTRLHRDVALKILPDAFATDPDRVARFQREATTLASLNHPNIAHIHGLEESNGVRALVMELVEGEDLSQRIARGPISIDEALPIAKQIAEALEAAHDQGIVHRDLKPANIKVRPDGAVKVLDFGLAKALEPTRSATDASLSSKITNPAMLTRVGVLLGTAAYMAPEQAGGEPVDQRADIWAFGCVLYEMLTGKRAFEGVDVSDTLAAVLRGAPDWSAMPSQVSPTLLAFLRRCLTRDAAHRVHDIADMRLALEGAFDVPVEHAPTSPIEVRKPPWRLIAAGTAVIAAGAAVLGGFGASVIFPGRPPSVARLTATPLNGLVPPPVTPDIAVSGNGSRFAYGTLEQDKGAVYVRSLDQLDAVRIEGVDSAHSPFFSPDGQSIGFFDATALKRVSASGGPVVTVTLVKGLGRGGSWGADDSIIFATSMVSGLLRVGARGGEITTLTKPNPPEVHLFPELLPGGRAVLFTILVPGQSVSNAQIAVLDLASGTQKVLLSGASHGKYAASGHLVYGFNGTLRAVGFDLDTLTIRGTAVPVVERVVTKGGAANFAISSNGSLVYESGDILAHGERTLVWVDRQGREEVIAAAPKRSYAYPRISPDGTRVAIDIRDEENDIWVSDLTRLNLTRLTRDSGLNRGIVWTPDGNKLVFSSAERDGTESLFWQAADGSRSPERLTHAQPGRPQVPYSIVPDGTRLVFGESSTPPFDLYTLQFGADPRVAPLLNSSYIESNAEVSPNGRWLAYQSDESGIFEIYVRPFPNVDSGRRQISTGGGTRPAWERNGRELFYLKGDGTMVAVPIHRDAAGSFSAGTPASLFQGAYFTALSGRTYDVAPNGSRFLMVKSAAPTSNSRQIQLVVVQHWFEELKRLVPTK